ncbi:hypothetical protein F4814DRAFT_444270 [Daldinia grandis]|nr:hypothetical protein F4814DRAFT_444270 [Daldinia grandis]
MATEGSPTRATSDQAKKQTKYPTFWIRYFESGELKVWRVMMYLLGFAEKFTSKNQCRRALKHTWVNIVDFFETIKTRSRPHFFANHYQLGRAVRFGNYSPTLSPNRAEIAIKLIAQGIVGGLTPERSQIRGHIVQYVENA